jgi:hypothetical protein
VVRIPNTADSSAAGTSQLLNVNVNSSLESMTTLRPTTDGSSNLMGVPPFIDVNLLMGTPSNIGSSSPEGRDQQGNASGAVGGFSGRNDTAIITSTESSVSASSRADVLSVAQNGNKEEEEGVDARGTSGGGEEEKVGDGQTALLGMRGRKGGHMYVNKK